MLEFNRDVIGMLFWRSLADPSIPCTRTIMTYEHILDVLGYPSYKREPTIVPEIHNNSALPLVVTALWLNYGVYFAVANKLFGGKLGEIHLLSLVMKSADVTILEKQASNIIANSAIEDYILYKPYLPEYRHKHKRNKL